MKRPARRKTTTAKPKRNWNRETIPSDKVSEFPMRLNKYIAHCGICSRRQAIAYVRDGLVTVNGEKIIEPGVEVNENDKVTYKGALIRPEGRKVYILMNKPRDVLTTVTDDRGRKTVMDILKTKVTERIFPVGRLDRNTTGLLLLTNDGDLAEKLAHPSHKVKKIYHVVLNKSLSKTDLEKIKAGITLEDGVAEVDGIDYVNGASKDEVGVEIHIGKNRIVRRIFEHLGYEVVKLDRVYYGGLTKKDLPRGFWRRLTQREVIMLKHFV
ncbi:MAG: rRNA pseudouridine synthase [Saprospiraceae bacterium]|nr:rRNA pseudouridine synthase [Saprospiraceae bacterium]